MALDATNEDKRLFHSEIRILYSISRKVNLSNCTQRLFGIPIMKLRLGGEGAEDCSQVDLQMEEH